MLRFLMAAIAVLTLVYSSGQAARAEEGPWCAIMDLGTGNAYWDCRFYSLEACRPYVISGNRGFCNPNPRYHGAVDRPAPRHHLHG